MIVLGVLALVILVFIYSRVKPYLQGPRIVEINLDPVSYQETYSAVLKAELTQSRSAKINTVSSPINERGEIRHVLALTPGRNIIKLELSDSFGKTKTFSYQIMTPSSEEIYPNLYNQAQEPHEENEEETLIEEPEENQ